MTNDELQESITMANAMSKAEGLLTDRGRALLGHLQALLMAQQRRASAASALREGER